MTSPAKVPLGSWEEIMFTDGIYCDEDILLSPVHVDDETSNVSPDHQAASLRDLEKKISSLIHRVF